MKKKSVKELELGKTHKTKLHILKEINEEYASCTVAD